MNRSPASCLCSECAEDLPQCQDVFATLRKVFEEKSNVLCGLGGQGWGVSGRGQVHFSICEGHTRGIFDLGGGVDNQVRQLLCPLVIHPDPRLVGL